MTQSVLFTHELSKSFGGLVVAKELNFSISNNEVRCIIGPNGAGKTTFFNLLSGLIPIDSGKVMVEDTNVTNLPVYKRQKLGLVRTFQAPRIFPELTVLDNIYTALKSKGSLFSLMKNYIIKNEDMEEMNELLEKVNLLDYKNQEAGSLSHGEKKRVEMAMAIIQKPKVLLMDEPTAGMAERETQEVVELIHKVKNDMAVLIVEHDMEFVRGIADQITVLYRGDIVREGTLEELENDSFIQEIYLGSVEI